MLKSEKKGYMDRLKPEHGDIICNHEVKLIEELIDMADKLGYNRTFFVQTYLKMLFGNVLKCDFDDYDAKTKKIRIFDF